MEIEPSAFSYQNKLKQEAFDDDRPKRVNEPSESVIILIMQELCETVLLLKQIMPHRSLQRAIIMLYESLVKKKTPQQIYSQTLQAFPDKPFNSPPQQQFQNSIGQTQVTRVYHKDELQKKSFSSDAEESRYKDKRLVAKSFVAKGYGHQYALDQFSKAKFEPNDKASSSYNKQVYKQTISAVITQAFRKLQSFLMEDCKRKLNALNKAQMKKLMTPLLSSSAFGQNLAIFKKYLRLLFGLSNVTLVEGQSIKFYLQALKHLNGGKSITIQELEAIGNNSQQKPEVSQTNSQNQQGAKPTKISQQNNNKISTSAKLQKFESENRFAQQMEIAKLYIQYQSLNQCYNYLNHKYDNLSELRLKFFSILRTIFRKIEQQNESQRKLYSYNQKDIEKIFSTKKGLKIRLLFLEYFVNPQNKSEGIIVQSINQFLSNKGEKDSVEQSLQDQSNQHNKFEDQIKQQYQSQ